MDTQSFQKMRRNDYSDIFNPKRCLVCNLPIEAKCGCIPSGNSSGNGERAVDSEQRSNVLASPPLIHFTFPSAMTVPVEASSTGADIKINISNLSSTNNGEKSKAAFLPAPVSAFSLGSEDELNGAYGQNYYYSRNSSNNSSISTGDAEAEADNRSISITSNTLFLPLSPTISNNSQESFRRSNAKGPGHDHVARAGVRKGGRHSRSYSGSSFSSNYSVDSVLSGDSELSESSVSKISHQSKKSLVANTKAWFKRVEKSMTSKPDPDPRPFKCLYPDCNKAFGRRGDLKRHTNTIHSSIHDAESKRCRCHGWSLGQLAVRNDGQVHEPLVELGLGTEWGCNDHFLRMDGLVKHWRESRPGKKCIAEFAQLFSGPNASSSAAPYLAQSPETVVDLAKKNVRTCRRSARSQNLALPKTPHRR